MSGVMRHVSDNNENFVNPKVIGNEYSEFCCFRHGQDAGQRFALFLHAQPHLVVHVVFLPRRLTDDRAEGDGGL